MHLPDTSRLDSYVPSRAIHAGRITTLQLGSTEAAAMIIRKQLPFKSADESEMKRVSQGDAIMATIHSKPSLDNDIQSTLRELIFDGLSPEQAATALEAQLKANR